VVVQVQFIQVNHQVQEQLTQVAEVVAETASLVYTMAMVLLVGLV